MDKELERWRELYSDSKRNGLDYFLDRVKEAKRLKAWCDEHWNDEEETCEDCLGIKYPELCFTDIAEFQGDEVSALPCPFCGGTASLKTKDHHYWIQCDECGATGPKNDILPMLVTMAWNRRE